MTALAAGTKVPDVELKTMDGKKFSLQAATCSRPRRAGFLQSLMSHMPVCLPIFERLHQAYGQKNVTLVAVSQNDAKETAAFIETIRDYFPCAARRYRTLIPLRMPMA